MLLVYRRALAAFASLAITAALLPPAAWAQTPPAESSTGAIEENLLAEPHENSSLPGTSERSALESFGAELALLNLEATWSGYGDILFTAEPGGAPSSFEAAHFNPILTARMGPLLSAEVEIEIEPGAIAAEYLIFDVSLSRAFALRFGKFLVPFGHFNEVLHPSFRWNMVTRPLMMREAVPATWTDVGMEVRGAFNLGAGTELSYAAYVTNGLAGGEDYLEEGQVARSMRDSLADNNSDKAFGARLSFEMLRGETFGATQLGLSAYSSAVNPSATDRYSLLGADFSVRLGDVTLRAEASQSYLGTDQMPLQPFEQGVYAQISYRFLQQFELAGRWDYISLRPAGGSPTFQRQAALSLGYSPFSFIAVRAEVNAPLPWSQLPRLALMMAFSF